MADLDAKLRAPSPTLRPLPVAGLGLGADGALRHYFGEPSPKAVLALFALAVAWRARLRGRNDLGRHPGREAAAVAGVVAWWPAQEWLAHKLILHAAPREVAGITIDPVVSRYHRAHHMDPWRIDLAFLPTWFILPAVAVSPLVWLGIARGRQKVAATGLAATAAMTLVYEWSHFLTHTSHRPRRQWYRTLQRRHRLHHFKDEHNWYGFTVPYVDDLLSTAPDPASLPTSPTVRTLGVEEPRVPAG